MTLFDLTFYSFASILLLASLRVITTTNPVHAALYLVLSFFTAGGIWLLLEAEFLAIALVLVYVGAVMVLFLFVVMMLDIDLESVRQDFRRALPLGVVLAIVMLAEIFWLLGFKPWTNDKITLPPSHTTSNSEALGHVLYTDYLWVFELAALVLLVAIVAAIALTLRRRTDVKRITVEKQLQANKQNRLRLVDEPSPVRKETS